ncbi:hypothetical protein MKW92_048912 [Papaver armeniacum]|nr:hypothetical protein MKW92_048912 [Papaver armeniacum]
MSKDAPKSSTLTSEKKLQFHVSSAFDPILSAVKWVFSSVTELVSPCRSSFVLEDDKIMFKLNQEEIAGVVQHVVHHRDRSMETTLQSENFGLLENFKISIYDVINCTDCYEENEKMWGIHTLVDCKDDDFEKMKDGIRDILNAHFIL